MLFFVRISLLRPCKIDPMIVVWLLVYVVLVVCVVFVVIPNLSGHIKAIRTDSGTRRDDEALYRSLLF